MPIIIGEKKTAPAMPATFSASALFAAAAAISAPIAVPPAIRIIGHAKYIIAPAMISHVGISKSIEYSLFMFLEYVCLCFALSIAWFSPSVL